MESDRAKLQEKKQSEINLLQEKLHEYESQIAGLTHKDQKEAFMNSDIVIQLKDGTRMNGTNCDVTEAEWAELYAVLQQCMPTFHATITQANVLSRQESQICVLTLMNVGTKEISNMLHSTSSRVSNAKASANHKLFGDVSGAQSLRRNIIKSISAE